MAALSIALREYGRRMDEAALRLLPEEAMCLLAKTQNGIERVEMAG